MALMAFVAVSLFVSAFLIVNTFSMLVSQRSRELGLLRAVGATSRQVFRSVLVEALAVGALASLAGFALGVAAAQGPATGCCRPSASSCPTRPCRSTCAPRSSRCSRAPRSPLLAALLPAVRAGRVPPIVAILGLTTGSARASRIRPVLGVVATVAGLGLAAAGVTAGPEGGLPRLGLGALLTFVGLALLARHAVRPMVAVLGRPWAPLLGVPGRLGCGPRDPQPAAHRHDLGRPHDRARARRPHQRLLRVREGVAGPGPGRGPALRLPRWPPTSTASTPPRSPPPSQQRPEFDTVAGLRFGQRAGRRRQGRPDGRRPGRSWRPSSTSTSRPARWRTLGAGNVLVHKDVAATHGWALGDTITMTFARVGEQQVQVAGTFAEKRLLGTDYVVALADHDAWFGHPLDVATLVTLADGVSPESAEAAFDTVLAANPDLRRRPRRRRRRPGQAARPGAGADHRHARPRPGDRPARHRQHPRAVGARAHQGGRAAAGGRDVATAAAPNHPLRGRADRARRRHDGCASWAWQGPARWCTCCARRG